MQRLSVLVVTLIALALAGPSAISAQNAGSSLDGLGLPELRVSVTDAGIDVPSQTEAGRYLVVLDNPSPYDVEVTLFLPPDGLTASQLEATPDAEEGDPDWFYDAIIVGGVAADAGGADRAVLDLAPAGEWVVVGLKEDGQVLFTVTGEAAPAPAIAADAVVEVRDFDFAIPAPLPAGRQVWG